ncbi:VOC family protein [Streptomyces sp. AP-93]|uniref:VOC family protein n=1 Tax=Streptomyces sp. AP-93 TaxID=2929048 RepID=UPI001FAF27EE|nr:VOC family protein [Streptomyces sp. AP-93]MCJ0868616.1 VOC family protein [Streptomyces sp. AP-93]
MSTSSHETFGAPCWVSLLSRDLAAAQQFYGAVLGWEFGPVRLGEAFSVGFADGIPVAGLGSLPPELSTPVVWTPYFAVDDADVTAARVLERSGTVAVGPLAFGTGRAALASDRDGAVFGIWQGDAIPDWGMGGDAAPAWLELRTRNAFDAAIFYGEVLEWACEHAGCCEVAYAEESERILLRHAGRTVARLHGGTLAQAPDPHLRPRWQVHFRVPDLGAAVKAALARGASTVFGPDSGPFPHEVTLRDPDGAVFSIAGPAGSAA